MKTKFKQTIVCAVGALFTALHAHAQNPTFKPGCAVPYARIAPTSDSFAACGNCGVAAATTTKTEAAAKSAENKAKNNLCADLTTPTVVDFAVLAKMQALPINKKTLGDRKTLKGVFPLGNQKIGEGSVVRLMAFVKEAHISDCDGGEEVNCKKTGPDVNDIHIPLVDPTAANPQTQDECTSVTAELIPHFRPTAWSQFDMKTPVSNPVRVTGQLFFDNSHDPCIKKPDGTFQRNKPARISLWEIHPVYQLEVCANTDPQQCDVNKDSAWVPYDEWVGRPSSVTQATGEHDRSECVKLNGKPSKSAPPMNALQCTTATKSPKQPKVKPKTPHSSPPG